MNETVQTRAMEYDMNETVHEKSNGIRYERNSSEKSNGIRYERQLYISIQYLCLIKTDKSPITCGRFFLLCYNFK